MEWRSVVVETQEGWFTAWAQPPGRSRPTPALQEDDLIKCQEAADACVPAHDCSCPPWHEVLLPRRWPRTPPKRALQAYVEGEPVVVLDVSYGGMRFESRQADIPPTFAMTFGGFDVTLRARAVWSRPSSQQNRWWWGAEVANDTERSAWWPLVDAVSEGS